MSEQIPFRLKNTAEPEPAIPRILLAAPASGSGKTVVSCALMAAFHAAGLDVRACKCGPDYIDPMFHREVLGIPSANLDLFFSGKEELRGFFYRYASGADLVITEGVMGYYDGLALDTEQASSYDVARTLSMPVILVLPARGAAATLAAVIKGMAEYKPDSRVRGVILNHVSESLYPRLAAMLKTKLSEAGHPEIEMVGFLPDDPAFAWESRHLGLVTPGELADLQKKTREGAKIAEKTLDLEKILQIAGGEQAGKDGKQGLGINIQVKTRPDSVGCIKTRPDCAGCEKVPEERQPKQPNLCRGSVKGKLRIGIAMDNAFCFYYRENLMLLEDLGCELVPFSPLSDAALPQGIAGLLFGGGYPELYAARLAANRSMLESVQKALKNKMPCLAECGGFMYLHEELEDREGNRYPLVGRIPGRCFPTGKLGRFGYVRISRNMSPENKTAESAPCAEKKNQENAESAGCVEAKIRENQESAACAEAKIQENEVSHGERIRRHETENDREEYQRPDVLSKIWLGEGEELRGHEFHYWDSTDAGEDCLAKKPLSSRQWTCVHMEDNFFAGYPHLYLPSLPVFAERYVQSCRNYRKTDCRETKAAGD